MVEVGPVPATLLLLPLPLLALAVVVAAQVAPPSTANVVGKAGPEPHAVHPDRLARLTASGMRSACKLIRHIRTVLGAFCLEGNLCSMIPGQGLRGLRDGG